MPYIGTQPSVGEFITLDALTASATADYSLTRGGAAFFPETVENLLVSINGVLQSPSTLSLSGNTLTVGATLSASDVIDYVRVLGSVGTIITPADGSVTSAKLGNSSVTSTKLDNGSVTSAKLDNGSVTSAKLDTNISIAGNLSVAGQLLIPSVIAWRVKRTNGNSGSAANGNGNITFNLEELNQGTAYNSLSDGGRVTAPVAGIYMISFTGRHNSQTATHCEFLKNGTAFLGFRSTSTGGTMGNMGISATAMVDLAVGDFIQVHTVSGVVQGTNDVEGAIFTGFFVG